MKYLETNAIRECASQLENREFIEDKFTSVLTILELLSGIKDDKSFKLRKSILEKVSKSRIRIIKHFPEIVILRAFGLNIENPEVTENIFRIVSLIIVSFELNDFLIRINENQLDVYWEVINKYDENADLGFKEAVHKKFINFDFQESLENFYSRWNSENFNEIWVNILEFFAEILLKIYPFKTNENVSQAIHQYDNTVDIYLVAITFFLYKKVLLKNFVGKNDYIDINHLVYLRGYCDQIVTNDKLIIELLNKVSPSSFLRVDEIKLKI